MASLTLNLTILVPPRAKSGQVIEEVEVTEGALAKFKCPVKTNPKFSWYKDGRFLSGDPHRLVGSGEAEGEYDYMVGNDAVLPKWSVIVQLSKSLKISPTGHETLTVEGG
ncbi:hypothetical protein Pcinc_024795 [Petrolisthes cinctipes]|uniref:Ig-like domain-containing protein n=1 Tax=Petrolisthes cinctipes TaxID=88211 RepID=A0AAE1FBD5_PETCI|nr:hypothetical protein Pcinc_024795 [Petrolisthes cinctipes]